VAGATLAGYALLPALGNRSTLALAVGANLAVGAVAIAGSRRWGALRAPVPGATAPGGATPGVAGPRGAAPRAARRRAASSANASTAPAPAVRASTATAAVGPPDLGAWLILGALGLSGAISMVYEVAWTRALAQVIGSSTYAFTAMLVAFLLGIAGGAALYARLQGDRPTSSTAFAVVQAGIGLTTGLVLVGFDRTPELFLWALGRSDAPAVLQFVQLGVSALALLPSTLLIGATFPGRSRRGPPPRWPPPC
jgi:hypothetical protein